ncbi:PREDICTED: uncharacterized protein LOC108369998 [Rhagoletis zephyria]|uniref:uncharacterized protein LOC108369998 n=1 Tax=Rhagoletis zephyria TaxID=28612 RepID=UPI0008112EAA|nr:PREDICTED: uncharacterized protein LOC108369998 [Rhagoletis zephyria]
MLPSGPTKVQHFLPLPNRKDVNRLILLSSLKEIANDLVDSSSSSTENEIETLVLGRNSQPRVNRFVDDVVNFYSEAEFKKNFRVSRDLTEYLVAKYSASTWFITRNYKGGRLQTPAESHMLAFLWFAAKKTTFREVGNIFDMCLSNMYNTFNKVLNFLVRDIAPEAIKFPNETHEKEVIAKAFENIAGFPNVLGCIDGSIHHSKLRFLDVFTGVPSIIHDARVLRLSFIGKELSSACAPKYHL